MSLLVSAQREQAHRKAPPLTNESTTDVNTDAFFVTFGDQYRYATHPRFPGAHPDGYLQVRAVDELSARIALISRIGRDWSCMYTRSEYSSLSAGEGFPTHALGLLDTTGRATPPTAGRRVTWSAVGETRSKTGSVSGPEISQAWTPNDLTSRAPDTNMVIVRWDNDADPQWEYVNELIQHTSE